MQVGVHLYLQCSDQGGCLLTWLPITMLDPEVLDWGRAAARPAVAVEVVPMSGHAKLHRPRPFDEGFGT